MTRPAEPYRLVDGKGAWLEVRNVTLVDGVRCGIATSGQAFIVDPAEIEGIARAMREACGVSRRTPAWVRITVPPWLARILIAAGAREAHDA